MRAELTEDGRFVCDPPTLPDPKTGKPREVKSWELTALLDGFPIELCRVADEERGEVVCYVGELGRGIAHDPETGERVRVTRRGRVELRWQPLDAAGGGVL